MTPFSTSSTTPSLNISECTPKFLWWPSCDNTASGMDPIPKNKKINYYSEKMEIIWCFSKLWFIGLFFLKQSKLCSCSWHFKKVWAKKTTWTTVLNIYTYNFFKTQSNSSWEIKIITNRWETIQWTNMDKIIHLLRWNIVGKSDPLHAVTSHQQWWFQSKNEHSHLNLPSIFQQAELPYPFVM